jgi:MFS family permease
MATMRQRVVRRTRRPRSGNVRQSWRRVSFAAMPGGSVGRRLALMAFIDAVGTGAFMAVSMVFLTHTAGLTTGVVGFGLSLGGAAALLTALPLGGAADRYGPRRLLVATSLLRAATFVCYPFVSGVAGFLTLVCVMGLVDRCGTPVMQALVGQVVSTSQRVCALAVMRSWRNIGFMAGSLLGSVALAADTWSWYAAVLLGNAASFAVFGLLAARLPAGAAGGPRVRRTLAVRALRDRPYIALALLNAVLILHIPLLAIGLPLWIGGHTSAPRVVIAPLLALNMALAVLFQVRASRGSECPAGAARSMRRAGFALAACCVSAAIVPPGPPAAAVGALIVCTVALTTGELYQSAGGWGLSDAFARPGDRAAYLSVFWLAVGVEQMAAPTIIALVLAGGALAWVGLGAALTAAGLAVPAVTRWAQRDRLGEQDRAAGPRPAVSDRRA